MLGDYLLHGDASAPDQPVNCRYACPNGDRSCCVVSARGVFIEPSPHPNLCFPQTSWVNPLSLRVVKKLLLKKLFTPMNQAGNSSTNVTLISMRSGISRNNGGIKFDLILVRSSTSGGRQFISPKPMTHHFITIHP